MKINCLFFVSIQCFLYAHPGATNEIYPRIVNGTPANLEEIYYQVSVQYRVNITENYEHICGGTVINLKTVLTAAQCVYKGNTSITEENIRVVSGTVSPSVNNSGYVRYVSNIVHHSSYKPGIDNFDYDVAVLKLTIPFQESTTLMPIEINTKTVSDGTYCVISGYGEKRGNLTRANVLIINHSVCKALYGDTVTNNMICAGGTSSNICRGDGGGPLVCNGKVVGIATSAVSVCNANYPGVYTDVSKFADWVMKNGASSSTASVLAIAFATLAAHLF